MQSILNHPGRLLHITVALLPLVAIAAIPADPSQGKRPSTMLVPDGAGVNAVPGACLAFRNLKMAYLKLLSDTASPL